jgi:hypothetical protein
MIMSANEARSNSISWEGVQIETKDSGLLDLTTATTGNGQGLFHAYADFDIESVLLNVTEVPVSAAGSVEIGDQSSDVSILDYSVLTTADLGLLDITDELVKTTIDAGDVVRFNTDGAATSAGEAIVSVVLRPRDPS